jgi:hypothetical protein
MKVLYRILKWILIAFVVVSCAWRSGGATTKVRFLILSATTSYNRWSMVKFSWCYFTIKKGVISACKWKTLLKKF